jgi:hypothetical protein
MSMRHVVAGLVLGVGFTGAAGLVAAEGGDPEPLRLAASSLDELAWRLRETPAQEPVWQYTFARLDSEGKFVRLLAGTGVVHSLIVTDDLGGSPVISVRDGSGQVIAITRGSVTLDVPFCEGLEINTGNSTAVLTVLYRGGEVTRIREKTGGGRGGY